MKLSTKICSSMAVLTVLMTILAGFLLMELDKVNDFVYPVMVVGHILFENVIADVVFYDFLIYPVCVVRFLSFPFRRRSRLSL